MKFYIHDGAGTKKFPCRVIHCGGGMFKNFRNRAEATEFCRDYLQMELDDGDWDEYTAFERASAHWDHMT